MPNALMRTGFDYPARLHWGRCSAGAQHTVPVHAGQDATVDNDAIMLHFITLLPHSLSFGPVFVVHVSHDHWV